MTSDEAGQSWLDRTTAIVAEYQDPKYSREAVHNESALAAHGISQLLENRGTDMSPQMVDWLGQAADVNAQINSDTLSDSYKSPWTSAASGFGQDLKQELQAGAQSVKQAASDVASKFALNLTVVAIAAVVVLILIAVLEKKATALA